MTGGGGDLIEASLIENFIHVLGVSLRREDMDVQENSGHIAFAHNFPVFSDGLSIIAA